MTLLVDPAWLAARLADPRLRIFDVTVGMQPQPVGASRIISGRQGWAAGHIPSAGYLHMTEDLSAPRADMPYNLPPPAQMTALLQRHGVNQDSVIVVYGGEGHASAITRAWWVLRASGAADVRLLDGGLKRWVAEGHPLAREAPSFPPGDFVARAQPEMLADRGAILAALDDHGAVLVNALTPEQFRGSGGARYGRAGRIPRSVNLPSQALLDPATGRWRGREELQAMFRAAGLPDEARVITYCGGGIAASATIFALHLLGRAEARLYDASLLEWARDETLPMEVG